MKKSLIIQIAGLSVVLFVHQAGAIAVENLSKSEISPTNENFFGSSFNWDYCYEYKNASSAAVDHYWILTAGHVADDNPSGDLDIDGITYEEQEVVIHPSADIALVRYDKPLPGYYLLADDVPVGGDVILCGFGFSGDVQSTPSQAYFTDSGTDRGVKRWGSNRIDEELLYPYEAPAPLGMTTNQGFNISISYTPRFGSGDETEYEAGANVYDSGSGMFIEDNGMWKIVGTMTSRTNNGVNYTGNFAVSTDHYTDWIKSVIVDYDTDMDGLPDWWELKYGSDETSMERDGLLDSDIFSNYDEWIADTDPTNSASFLEITEWADSDIIFDSSTSRWYRVESNVSLTDTNESWGVEADWFEATLTQTVQSVSFDSSNRFYRVLVKPR